MKKNLPVFALTSVAALGGLASTFLCGPRALADDGDSRRGIASYADNTVKTQQQAEDVDVNKIKQRYWSRGDESDMGVVQNRLYSKAGKFEISGFGGVVNSDPFLTVYNAGASVGYHFTEALGVDAIAWRSFWSPSSALNTLRATGQDTNINPQNGLIGGEVNWSVLYGKLSLLGAAIIHYDLHLLGGAGMTSTANGNYLTGIVGIGQQFYLNQYMTLNLDFRLTPYQEDIVNRVSPLLPNYNQVTSTQMNWSNTITLGLSFLI